MTKFLQLLLAIEIVIFFTILYYRWARTKSKAQKTGIILIGSKCTVSDLKSELKSTLAEIRLRIKGVVR